MEILILKNNDIYARTSAEEGTAADYKMVIVENVPEYPKEKPNTGKYWELVYREGVLSWEEKDRPLTAEERLALVEAEVDAIKREWKVGEAVNVGDRRYYMGVLVHLLTGTHNAGRLDTGHCSGTLAERIKRGHLWWTRHTA